MEWDEVYTSLKEEEELQRKFAFEQWSATQSVPIFRGRGRPKKLAPPLDLEPLTREEMKGYNRYGMLAAEKTENLLYEHELSLDQWAPDGDTYKQYKQRDALQRLNTLQMKIIHVVTERTVESIIIKRRVKGHKSAIKFSQAISQRWSSLKKLVIDYNKELDALKGTEFEVNLRELNLKSLKEDGIDYSEIWDLDRLMANSDWAVLDYVREGIEALTALDRADEEEISLKINCERAFEWLKRQLYQIYELICGVRRGMILPIRLQALVELLSLRESMLNSLLCMKGIGSMLSIYLIEEMRNLAVLVTTCWQNIDLLRDPNLLRDPYIGVLANTNGEEDIQSFSSESEGNENAEHMAEYLAQELAMIGEEDTLSEAEIF